MEQHTNILRSIGQSKNKWGCITDVKRSFVNSISNTKYLTTQSVDILEKYLDIT